MNYFEHHIGDYDKNTAHLSACEDGIYCRLIRRYYDKEVPLIADIKELQRLVRARTKEEKNAVVTILSEFFFLESDGYHHKTCDEVIAAFVEGEPERELKKANEDNRVKRHREERAKLFKALTDAGQHAPWNIGIADLRELVKKLPATNSDTPETVTDTQPATAPATLATATQSPLPTTQSPDTSIKNLIASAVVNNPPAKSEAHAQTDSLSKFPMRTEWKPSPEIISAVCMRSGCLPSIVTQAALADFVGYWSSEQKVFTEAQWAQKLIDSAKRYALKNPEVNPNAARQPTHSKPDNSAAGRVRANIERDRAADRAHALAVANDGLDVRPQVGEQLRGGSRSGPGMGELLEGDFSRADQTRAEPLCD